MQADKLTKWNCLLSTAGENLEEDIYVPSTFCNGIPSQHPIFTHIFIRVCRQNTLMRLSLSYLAGRSPYISLKIKKRHYEHEHHMIEAHKYLITWLSDDIFENSG
jgi:hypothetical protein